MQYTKHFEGFISVQYRDMWLLQLVLSSVVSIKCEMFYEPAEHLYDIFFIFNNTRNILDLWLQCQGAWELIYSVIWSFPINVIFILVFEGFIINWCSRAFHFCNWKTAVVIMPRNGHGLDACGFSPYRHRFHGEWGIPPPPTHLTNPLPQSIILT